MMEWHFWFKLSLAGLLILSSTTSLIGSTVSFSGVFSQDDNVQLFGFSVSAVAPVTLRTWSFAGGTNAASDVIPAGGFAPVLSLFDASGNWLATDRDGGTGACGPRGIDPTSNFCWDAYLNPTLSPGNYKLALTEDDNIPAGGTLADGFTEAGNGNFTGPLFLGPGGAGLSFILADGSHRTANWAVDIIAVDSATQLPEPGPAALGAAGLALLFGLRRVTKRIP